MHIVKAREGFSAQGGSASGGGNGSPTVVLAHCIKGKYYGANENTADSHGSPAKSEEYLEIMKERLALKLQAGWKRMLKL